MRPVPRPFHPNPTNPTTNPTTRNTRIHSILWRIGRVGRVFGRGGSHASVIGDGVDLRPEASLLSETRPTRPTHHKAPPFPAFRVVGFLPKTRPRPDRRLRVECLLLVRVVGVGAGGRRFVV